MLARTSLLAIFSAAACLSAVAQAQLLVAQETRGVDRLCVYERQTMSGRQRDVVKIGLGEPCPDRQPPPVQEPVEEVPFMAQLVRDWITNGERVCIYAFSGRRYQRAIPTTSSCPITPYFNSR